MRPVALPPHYQLVIWILRIQSQPGPEIWALASDWEVLVTGDKSAKQIILGLVLHRLTASKEGINMLHKSNHVISYNNILTQNKAWSKMVASNPLHFPTFRKGVSTHSTIDNNDGSQETWTGKGTTHDTNKTLFQAPSKNEVEKIPVIGDSEQIPLVLNDDSPNWSKDPLPYTLGKRVGPPLLPNLNPEIGSDLLEESLRKDIAWSLCGIHQEEGLPMLGSWTAFNKKVSNYDTTKIVQEYLPVSPHPPEYPICKEYLDFLLDVMEELEIPFIFAHSDEAVYSKLCDILWKNPEMYSRIILLMGGFHQLRVMQRILYKRHYCKGYMDWCIDAETIAKGSAEQAFEGRHYYRCMRVHKECFDALVQFRVEAITTNLSTMSPILKEAISSLRKDPSPATLETLMNLDEFDFIAKEILRYQQGSDGELTVTYLKDVSLMLSLVAAVREADVEKHLQAERKLSEFAIS